jgi:hypothetical protein
LAPTTTTTPSMTNSSITTNPPIVSTPTLASPYSNINPSTVNFNPRFADDDWADFTKASISTPSTSTGPAPVSTTTAAVTISSTTTTNLSSAPTTQSTANDVHTVLFLNNTIIHFNSIINSQRSCLFLCLSVLIFCVLISDLFTVKNS